MQKIINIPLNNDELTIKDFIGAIINRINNIVKTGYITDIIIFNSEAELNQYGMNGYDPEKLQGVINYELCKK